MKKRSNYSFFIILGIIILLVGLVPSWRIHTKSGLSRILRRPSAGLESLSHRFRNTFSFWTNIGNLKKQNDELGEKLVALKVDSSQIEELENENALLKKELGFVTPDNQGQFVPARIIERDPSTFFDSIVIDVGSDDGIKNGMAVVSNGVLVGQIKNVMKKTSTVLLITSKDSIVQAMLQNSRSKGVLKGGISGLYLDDITIDTQYTDGENIVTSGLGGQIAAGMLIGTAGKIDVTASSIFKKISVDSIVDISKLELVFVRK